MTDLLSVPEFVHRVKRQRSKSRDSSQKSADRVMTDRAKTKVVLAAKRKLIIQLRAELNCDQQNEVNIFLKQSGP